MQRNSQSRKLLTNHARKCMPSNNTGELHRRAEERTGDRRIRRWPSAEDLLPPRHSLLVFARQSLDLVNEINRRQSEENRGIQGERSPTRAYRALPHGLL